MEPTVTQTFTVVALRVNSAAARAKIPRSAELFEVTLDSVQERSGRLDVEFVVTVTGRADLVAALRKELGGKNDADTGWINQIINTFTGGA